MSEPLNSGQLIGRRWLTVAGVALGVVGLCVLGRVAVAPGETEAPPAMAKAAVPAAEPAGELTGAAVTEDGEVAEADDDDATASPQQEADNADAGEPPSREPSGMMAPLRVVEVSPGPGEEFEGSIRIRFSERVTLPFGSGEALLKKPPLPGEVLLGDDFVVFRVFSLPSEQQTYVVELNPKIQTVDGRVLSGPRRYFFTSSNHVVVRLWEIDDTTLGVRFAGEVAPATVQSHLEVWSGGKQEPVAVEAGETPHMVRVGVPSGLGRDIEVVIKGGLTDVDGTVLTDHDLRFSYEGRPALAVKKAEWDRYSWDGQSVRLGFSARVRGEALNEALKITDAESNVPIGFNLNRRGTSTSYVAWLDTGGVPPARIVVELAGDLTSDTGEPLAGDYRKVLVGPELKIALERTHWMASWYRPEKDGLSLQLILTGRVDVAELRKHLEIEPEVEDLRVEPFHNGFRIFGEWMSGAPYHFRIKAGMRDKMDKALEDDLAFDLVADPVPGYVGFAAEGLYYFPRRTGLALPVETRNADSVRLELYRMFPNNIAVAVNEMDGRGPDGGFGSQWSERVAQEEFEVAGRADRIVQTPLDVDALFPEDKRGVFMLQATATGKRVFESGEPQRWSLSTSKVVVWTDIGALAHWQTAGKAGELAVFVHDLYSLKPLELAKVTVYSSKNQLLGTANTDARGIARLQALNNTLGTPHVAVIEREDDYTFLQLQPRAEGREAIGAQMPRYDRDGYDAFVYADRELYRPGETVHAHWLVRTNYGAAAAGVPLMVTVMRPNGRELLSEPTVLSEMGTGGLDIETEKVFQTGKYRVWLSVPGEKTSLGDYEFNLEEFVPNRIEAEVSLTEMVWYSGKSYPIEVNARHLFGAPAADRKAEAVVIFKRGEFSPAGWDGYRFDNDSNYLPPAAPCGEKKTDAEGRAKFWFQYAAPARASFPMKARVIGRVFELGGRPVSAVADSAFFPSDICLGVATASPAEGEGIEVLVAGVKPDGTAAELDQVSVTLEREVWNYYVRRYYSHHEPNFAENYEEVETREIALDGGKGGAVFRPQTWGRYRVRVHSKATPQYSTVSFYNYGGGCQVTTGERPSLITLTLDRESYAPGDEVVARIESPFDGQGIVVVQGEGIREMMPIEIKDGVAEARFAVSGEDCPNVWVEATVIHAVQEDRRQVYPFSSFAMANARVLDGRRRLNVELPGLPEEIRPETTARFRVSVRDSDGAPAEAELTLAAVDEGIHLITGYESPDPYEYAMRARKPDFRRAHYYDKVAYNFDKTPIGGGNALRDLEKRLPAVDENWIKPVALWSGTVRTDAAGAAEVAMDVPEYSGRLRLAVVACTEKAVGSASGGVYVRRPYRLRTSMPRFMLPGDMALCRAVVFNNTGKACRAKVSWSGSGTIAAGPGSGEVEVPPHGEQALTAEFTAAQAIGQGEIRWEAVVSDAASGEEVERLVETAPLPVRAPGAYQTRHETIVLKPGEAREFRNTVFLDDGRTELALTVGRSPMLRLEKALEYVVGYPHGCVEQTVSRLMPMYLLRKNRALAASVVKPDALDAYMTAGIQRLFLMQAPSGGLSFWPGGQQAYDYGSVYALHFLTLVKKGREYDVPSSSFKALQDYVQGLAFNTRLGDSSSLFLRAYAVYVLALDGDLEAIQQIGRFDAITMPRHARYLLAAALALNTRDTDRVKMYMTTAPTEPYTIQEADRTLNSEVRNKAIELLALVRMKGDPEEARQRAEELGDWLAEHHYGTTQESAFVITALAEYLGGVAENTAGGSAKVSGPDGTATVSGGQIGRFNHTGAGGVFTVENTGQSDIFVNFTVQGVPEAVDLEPFSAGGISVKRDRFKADGTVSAPETCVQGDGYVVELTVTCKRLLKNVVVVDMLPAGFEIENPRLDETSLPPEKLKGAVAPSYLDVRDDRLIGAFDALQPGEHHLYYVVRAVTPGEFAHPSATAECMYDPETHARTSPGRIEVIED